MEKKEEKLYFELVDVLKTYMTEDELKQINKAYDWRIIYYSSTFLFNNSYNYFCRLPYNYCHFIA